jgi:hypothetical protein
MTSKGTKSLLKPKDGKVDKPFDGMFGDTAELRVLQEIVADPYSDYSHRDLMEFTELSDPSVRRAVRALMDADVIRNISTARRSPMYRANQDSRRLSALMFLTYAILDDKTGSETMDGAVAHYCDLTCTRDSHIDFFETPSVGGKAGKTLKGMRVHMSEADAKKLSDVLQGLLRKADKRTG